MSQSYADLEILSVPAAAEARRSIRAYKRVPVPDEDLREIVRLTGLAPSAFNVQPWRFVVVTDPAMRAELARAANNQRQVSSAPAVIVMYSDMRDAIDNAEEIVHPGVPDDRRAQAAAMLRNTWKDRSDADREAWGAGQSYIALGYLLLAATAFGYGTSPMLGFDAAEVKRVLNLPAHVAIPAIVAVGIADEEGFPHHRHPVDRIARFM
jgi:nitroreductase